MRLKLACAASISLFLVVAGAPAFAAGCAVGASGVVLKSTDAGANWNATSPAGVTLTAASFVNDNEGWVVGAGGLAMHTTNGGSSWLQSSPTVVNLNDVMFVDAAHGWAVGNSGTVIRTISPLRFFIVNLTVSPSRTCTMGPGTAPPNVHAW